jgi:hypothetical protein
MATYEERQKAAVPGYLKFSKIITYILYIWVIFGIIILGLRVFLLATSANPTTPFVNFIYETSASFLQPFRGIFPAHPIGETGYLDVAAVFAMIMYALIAWGFSALISYVQDKIDQRKAAVPRPALAPVIAQKRPTARGPSGTRSSTL